MPSGQGPLARPLADRGGARCRHVVVWRETDYFFPAIPAGYVHPLFRRHEEPAYTLSSRVLNKLRVWPSVYFGPWHAALRRGERVLFTDNGLRADSLRRLWPYRRRMIVFLWNPIGPGHQFIVDRRDELTIYSHDRSDCRRYGLRFNTTFYEPLQGVTPHAQSHDIVFVGAPKDRMPVIDQLYAQLRPLDCLFHVLDKQAGCKVSSHAGVPLFSEPMTYRAYLSHLLASRAVLDILQQHQNSLTLRAMEAMFYRKKLITTYAGIVDEPFYRPSNIHVIHDVHQVDVAAIRRFLALPYEELPASQLDDYRFDRWLDRFE